MKKKSGKARMRRELSIFFKNLYSMKDKSIKTYELKVLSIQKYVKFFISNLKPNEFYGINYIFKDFCLFVIFIWQNFLKSLINEN